MPLGFNTHGLDRHRLIDAIHLLADQGYQRVAIALDAGALDPYDDPTALERQVRQVRGALNQRGLARVVETGARYLLNPRRKHDPTLMDPDPARRTVRIDFLGRAIDLAKELEAVSFWSGILGDPISEDEAMDRLVEGLRPVVAQAEAKACGWPSSPSRACSSTCWRGWRSSTRGFGTPLLTRQSTSGMFIA